jgi:hypothetical protein
MCAVHACVVCECCIMYAVYAVNIIKKSVCVRVFVYVRAAYVCVCSISNHRKSLLECAWSVP